MGGLSVYGCYLLCTETFILNSGDSSGLAERYTVPSVYPSWRPDLRIRIHHWEK